MSAGSSTAIRHVALTHQHVDSAPPKWPRRRIQISAAIVLVFFFFQAEDGIRDADVTGVQTCALPICESKSCRDAQENTLPDASPHHEEQKSYFEDSEGVGPPSLETLRAAAGCVPGCEIGRASCRERV